MSNRAVQWAFDQEIKPATAKLVLLFLAHSLNGETGKCCPSIACIVEKTGMAEATVLKAIKTLEGAGLIRVRRSHKRVNHYEITPPVEPESTQHFEGRSTPKNWGRLGKGSTPHFEGQLPQKLGVNLPQKLGDGTGKGTGKEHIKQSTRSRSLHQDLTDTDWVH